MPEAPGKLPRYVQRSFRLKALGLVSLQLLVVFGIMLLVAQIRLAKQWGPALHGIFFVLAVLLVFALAFLGAVKTLYPANYIMLALITVLAGLAWGVSGRFMPASIHLQVVGIMCSALVVTTMSATLLSYTKLQPWDLLLTSVFTGWAVGSLGDIIVAGWLGCALTPILAATTITLLLHVFFVFDCGRLLVDCNVDAFMSVVVAMDSTLLVVVSIPIVWAIGLAMLTSLFLHGAEAADPDGMV